MYKNASEEKLLKQVNLSDLTAAAYLKDPKGRRQHMFGLFTPSHNYQFQAANDAEARTWVELIRTEARIDEEEESVIFGSPPAIHNPFASKKTHNTSDSSPHRQDHDRLGSSSPEPPDTPLPPTVAARDGIRIPGARQLSTQELDYSGQEHGSYSDFSDTALYGTSAASVPQTSLQAARANTNTNASLSLRPSAPRNPSQANATNTEAVAKNNNVSASAGNANGAELDEERVIWQGYLLCLKSKGGVRQWKRLWVVLRPKHMAFYKNEEVSPHTSLSPYRLPIFTTNPLRAGILRPPPHPLHLYPLRHRNRPHQPKQKPLHADHCRRQELPLLRAKRGGASEMFGRIEESAGEEEGQGKEEDGCVRWAEAGMREYRYILGRMPTSRSFDLV